MILSMFINHYIGYVIQICQWKIKLIYYHIRENDNLEKYSANQYLDKGEILKYFNKEIIYIAEGYNVSNKAHYNRLYDHTHKIGYIIIQNKEKQIKERVYPKYEIVIGINNWYEFTRRNIF